MPSQGGFIDIDNAVDISLSGTAAYMLTADGWIAAWGDNSYGELGNNSTSVSSDSPVAVQLSAAVSSGLVVTSHSKEVCATTPWGTIDCTGAGAADRLDYNGGTASDSFDWAEWQQDEMVGVVQFSAGELFSCAVISTGSVTCWGTNNSGQVTGDGHTSTATYADTFIPLPSNGCNSGQCYATEVAAGYDHACALTSIGTVYCWGGNAYGQLGNGSTSSGAVAVTRVLTATSTPLTGVTGISANAYMTCATAAGNIYCWGNDTQGQITTCANSTCTYDSDCVSTGTSGCSSADACAGGTCISKFANTCSALDNLSSPPLQVVAIGGPDVGTACALEVNGTVQCWGSNSGHAEGSATASSCTSPQGPSVQFTTLNGSGRSACGREFGGTVACWGANGDGQVGTGNTTAQSSPQQITWGVSGANYATDALAVAIGATDGCIITNAPSGGSSPILECWGDNTYGEFGDGAFGTSGVIYAPTYANNYPYQ
jgi:alpha-tubulin suppressor-like RCC1 family protein